MWGWGAWDWVIVAVAYVVGLGFFNLLGGFAAASRAIQSWGRSSSARRIDRVAPRYAQLVDRGRGPERRLDRG